MVFSMFFPKNIVSFMIKCGRICRTTCHR